jgi:hypothetical protein
VDYQEFVLAVYDPTLLLGNWVINSNDLLILGRDLNLQLFERYQAEQSFTHLSMLSRMRSNKDVAPGLYQCLAMSRGATATDP